MKRPQRLAWLCVGVFLAVLVGGLVLTLKAARSPGPREALTARV